MIRHIWSKLSYLIAALFAFTSQDSRIQEVARSTQPPKPTLPQKIRKAKWYQGSPHQGVQECLRRRMGGFYNIRKSEAIRLQAAGLDPTSWEVQAQVRDGASLQGE